MKAATFELTSLESVADAAVQLASPGVLCLAGGQSLGPMLNLRAVRPERLISLGALVALKACEDRDDTIVIGACVTHAAIEDGKTPDIVLAGQGRGVLASIAGGIAYRAVRNRGTIGGSLCHADPAADWVTTLTALGASVRLSSGRSMKIADFIVGAYRTARTAGEMVTAISIPRPSPAARWGYYKACRKPGEFAHAMAAVLLDPERGTRRAVIGATGDKPILLTGKDASVEGVIEALRAHGVSDPIALKMQANAAQRAFALAGETP